MDPFETPFHDGRAGGASAGGRSDGRSDTEGASRLSPRRRLQNLSQKTRRNLLILLIACAAVGFLAYTILSEQGSFVIVPGAQATGTQASNPSANEDSPGSEGAIAGSSLATEPKMCVVYVTGAVIEPGLFSLAESARIGDAVAAAGGFSEDAATAALNLAQPLVDGSHIHVPTKEEVAHGTAAEPVQLPEGGGSSSSGYGSNGSVTGSQNPSQQAPVSSKVNINTASLSALQTLSGIGPVTAQRIIDYRTAHGPFKTKEEIKNVSGIGDKKYAAIADYITV